MTTTPEPPEGDEVEYRDDGDEWIPGDQHPVTEGVDHNDEEPDEDGDNESDAS